MRLIEGGGALSAKMEFQPAIACCQVTGSSLTGLGSSQAIRRSGFSGVGLLFAGSLLR